MVIGDVYTKPAFRLQGYAHLLMDEVIKWLKNKGVDTIRLLASEEARPMYIKFGFMHTDEMELTF